MYPKLHIFEYMKKVGIWIRVSTDMQAQSDSPKHHEERARAYALSKGWEIVTVYHLEAVSGKDVMHHSEAVRMLGDIQHGRITGIIFSKIARLARNTMQLLEIAKIFESYEADLISLAESIDTSSPAGRFFFTLISAMAQWEREEIGARVKASVKVRAKLGKPLGGVAPYGYAWEGKDFVLNEEEASVRKYMYELYKKHKKKKSVCRILKKEGYRTRKGNDFLPLTLTRLLRDPVTKGLRRVNYTQKGTDSTPRGLKPSDEWIFQEAPAIVSEELWQEVNDILDSQMHKKNYPRNSRTNIFTGFAYCACGGVMHVRTVSPRYVCQKCKRKIRPEDLEHIFYTSLSDYIHNEKSIQNINNQHEDKIVLEKKLLQTLISNKEKLQRRIEQLFKLNQEGQLLTENFKEHYDPVHAEYQNVSTSVEDKEREIVILCEHLESSEGMVQDAQVLYADWKQLSNPEKRSLVEAITERITISDTDINIQLRRLMPPHKAVENGVQTPEMA